jgi:hypothetical protein
LDNSNKKEIVYRYFKIAHMYAIAGICAVAHEKTLYVQLHTLLMKNSSPPTTSKKMSMQNSHDPPGDIR